MYICMWVCECMFSATSVQKRHGLDIIKVQNTTIMNHATSRECDTSSLLMCKYHVLEIYPIPVWCVQIHAAVCSCHEEKMRLNEISCVILSPFINRAYM